VKPFVAMVDPLPHGWGSRLPRTGSGKFAAIRVPIQFLTFLPLAPLFMWNVT